MSQYPCLLTGNIVRRFATPIIAAMVLPILLAIPSASTATTGITLNPHALLKTGSLGDGRWMLPSGRMIKPEGQLLEVGAIPLGLALEPGGRYLYVTNGGPGGRAITVIDTDTGEIIQTVPENSLYLGLAVSSDGKMLYASGGGDRTILVFDIDEGLLSPRATWTAKGIPGGIALSKEGDILFYASQSPRMVHAMDASTGKALNSSFTGKNPFTVVASPTRKEVYVSIEGENRVAVFNYVFTWWIREIASIDVGKNPQGMAISSDGRYLFVANADDDSFSMIDLDTREVIGEPDLRGYFRHAPGTAPNDVVISPNGSRLYIAQASENRITVVSLTEEKFVGALPTAWYPTAVAVSPDGDRLYAASGKGTGTSPAAPGKGLVNRGTVQIIDIPSDEELLALNDSIRVFNDLPGTLFDVDTLAFESPVPLERGGETPIKHVFFVVRENKTYDALLGDWEGGDGDPGECVYCYDETKNLHALVERFASGDNYYSNAEASIQGHCITTAAIANPYIEKQWALSEREIQLGLDIFFNPVSYPKNDFIFQNALRNDVTFRSYGETVGLREDWMIFDIRYVHWGVFDPPFFFMFSKDVNKLKERIIEWELGIFPQLLYMLFPNDHGMGYQWPFPTPEEMVADNDLATGRLLEWLSHSKYWEESVVFVIEDDPQEGDDHVDNHRSIALVAGPWVEGGYVSPAHYSEANIHATIQHILGLPPLTIYDEIAQPMWDLFTNEPDFTPYEAVETDFPGEFNLPGTPLAEASMGLNFLDPDEAEGLQGILKAGAIVTGKTTGGAGRSGNLDAGFAGDLRLPAGSGFSGESPVATLNSLRRMEVRHNQDGSDFESATPDGYFSAETIALRDRYVKLRQKIGAEVLPAAPLALFAEQIATRIRSLDSVAAKVDGSAAVVVAYTNGMRGDLLFVHEADAWKVDLTAELSNAVSTFEAMEERFEALLKAKEEGKPFPGADED